jgi:hypothetical protein
MSIEELRKIPNLKVRYLQVDSKNKYVPADWFIGFDSFTIYSFVNLLGFGDTSVGGYLKPLMRSEKTSFMIDFQNDFSQLGSTFDGLTQHLWLKLWLVFDSLWNLFIIMCCVVAICKVFLHSLSKNIVKQEVNQYYTPQQALQRRTDQIQRILVQNDDNPLTLPNITVVTTRAMTTTLIVTFLLSYLLLLLLLLSIQDYPNPDGITLIIYLNILAYLFGTVMLKHTQHRRHFFYVVITSSFSYYLYGRIYLRADLMLASFSYIVFVCSQALRDLNRFSFEFD